MGGENKNPRKHCLHRYFEEKKFNNQGFGVAVWHARAAVHVCRMPSILFVTLDENGACSAATESTTVEICIVLLTSKCATLFKLYSNAIHSAQIRLARFINAASHQIPLWPNISGSVMPATMAWLSSRKRCKSSRSGLRQHLHLRGTHFCRGPISGPRTVGSAPHSSEPHPTQIRDQNLRGSKTKCAAREAATSLDESALCFAWQFLFNFGETRTPVITQALRVRHK